MFGMVTNKLSADAGGGLMKRTQIGRHQHIPSPRRAEWAGARLYLLVEAWPRSFGGIGPVAQLVRAHA
jgi:hypothetical protein